MPEDSNQRGARDRDSVNMNEIHEVNYWTRELGVDEETLKGAVAEAGISAKAVRKHLQERFGGG